MRVLLVDDDPDLAFVLTIRLQVDGHEVTHALDGAAALDRLDAFGADVVVTDMMMPVMDGAELIVRLRNDPIHAGLPIIMFSATPELAGDVRADVVINKSSGIGRLAAAVADFGRDRDD